VKYHFVSQQGRVDLTSAEAEDMDRKNPNSCTEDPFASIDKKRFPEWKFMVQIMNQKQAQAHEYRFDPFDVTKMSCSRDFPLLGAGVMELNRSPANCY